MMAAPLAGDSSKELSMTESTTEQEQFSAVFTEGQLSYLGHDVEKIPPELIAEYAHRTVRLDLSFNRIRSLAGLEEFTQLRELFLDNNELNDKTVFPHMKSLTTLFMNKNRFLELDPLLSQLKIRFPELQYLSLLGNAACPNQLSSVENDEEDYQRYRYYVLYNLPRLKFLDSSAVHTTELIEAKRRGQFMQVVRPSTENNAEEISEITSKSKYSPLPESKEFDETKQIGMFSKSKHNYYGRHSEGNRFIRNRDL